MKLIIKKFNIKWFSRPSILTSRPGTGLLPTISETLNLRIILKQHRMWSLWQTHAWTIQDVTVVIYCQLFRNLCISKGGCCKCYHDQCSYAQNVRNHFWLSTQSYTERVGYLQMLRSLATLSKMTQTDMQPDRDIRKEF